MTTATGTVTAPDGDLCAAPQERVRRSMQQRRWRQALRDVDLELARRDGDEELLAARAVCLSELGRHRRAGAVVARLQASPTPEGSATLTSAAVVALGRGRWSVADDAARRALARDPGNPDAWACLAASYAGLGWFDEAERCLAQAEAAGLSPAAFQRVARAVNRWALGRARIAMVAIVVLVLGGGLLAAAAAVTTPFVTRQVRVRRLPPLWRQRAEHAWATEAGLRVWGAIAAGTAVLVHLLFFVPST